MSNAAVKFSDYDILGERSRVLEYWLPLLVWLSLIYFVSTDDFSAGETSRIIIPLLHFFFPGLSPDQLLFWHGVIRKLGHVSEYFILAVLTYRALKYDEFDLAKAKALSFTFVILIAMTDEFHQSFSMQRGASIIDVGYDGFGGLLSMWLTNMFRR